MPKKVCVRFYVPLGVSVVVTYVMARALFIAGKVDSAQSDESLFPVQDGIYWSESALRTVPRGEYPMIWL